jgi:hypothetical protein
MTKLRSQKLVAVHEGTVTAQRARKSRLPAAAARHGFFTFAW